MNPSFEQKTDEKLAVLALSDADAFGQLVGRYERRLYFYILRISSFGQEDARDVLQEVFLKAWKNLRGFDSGLSFSSWIYRICRNHTISCFRKHKSRGQDKQLPLDTELFDPPDRELPLPERIDQKIQGVQIRAILAKMSKQYRDVLVLKYFEDRSYAEISDIIRKPEGTVATYLHRAKKQFKKYAAGEEIALQ